MMNLNSRIERFLKKSGLRPAQLGRALMGDPSFIRQLRNGREPRPETRAKIASWLDEAEKELENASCAK